MQATDKPRPTILVVDDQPHVVRLVQVYLGKAGFEVQGAGDGKEGVERALAIRPDLIITDVIMPRMDGFALLREVREMLPDTPVIVLSVRCNSPDFRARYPMDADEYVCKPFHPKDLLAAAQRILGYPQASPPLTHAPEGEPGAPASIAAVMQPIGSDSELFTNALLHRLGNEVLPIRELLLLLRKDPGRERLVQLVEQHLENAIRLVDRLETPLPSMRDQELEGMEVLRDAVQQARLPRGIRVQWNGPAEGLRIVADRQALNLVVSNLIGNAALAMQGEGELRLTCERHAQGWAEIVIRDTGTGITPEARPQLFQPFFTTRKHQGGQGLGLWISRALAERMGGALELVDTQVNGGAAFRLRLRTPQADRGAGEPAPFTSVANERIGPVACTQAGAPARVVLEEAGNRDSQDLRDLLRELRRELLPARSWADALSAPAAGGDTLERLEGAVHRAVEILQWLRALLHTVQPAPARLEELLRTVVTDLPAPLARRLSIEVRATPDLLLVVAPAAAGVLRHLLQELLAGAGAAIPVALTVAPAPRGEVSLTARARSVPGDTPANQTETDGLRIRLARSVVQKMQGRLETLDEGGAFTGFRVYLRTADPDRAAGES